VKLVGPGELEALDVLTVTIRDYSHYRLKPAPAPGQPPESVSDYVLAPLRLVPGVVQGPPRARVSWVPIEPVARSQPRSRCRWERSTSTRSNRP